MIILSLCVLIGLGIGYFFGDFINFDISTLIQIGLYLLLFFIGIDIGKNKNIFNDLKKIDKKVLLLPFITMLATLLGGAVASLLLSLSLGEAVAVSSGMGWYSFSAIELSKVSVELGGIAFLSNIFRELLAILTIPFIAKKIGAFESVSVAGATAMDSVLPVINKSNTAEISIVSFYSGLVISLVVPILVPFIITIFNL
ncbi:MAG: lysine exporter LysO family protein [Fusobacterium gastrosuis]|uniref:lysine exporter LysO family protein n=1 Tax=Fusobacterium TaxID=848 RepID=UPI001F4FE497|nr:MULTISPECIES: lysine exporter LysO family protein [Fusobacterium]MCI5724309.1 lysine exporter LysO family protein [Fusobacterium sp.]MDY4011093.1 lysine exporter LysO family protein [Fusobacterium gastrosuis]